MAESILDVVQEFITEDVGFDPSKGETNGIGTDVGTKSSYGKKTPFSEENLIFRAPYISEIREAKVGGSTAQAVKTYVFGRVLADFGIINPRDARKVVSFERVGVGRAVANKYMDAFDAFFSYFSDDSPWEEMLSVLKRSSKELHNDGVKPFEVLKNVRKWSDLDGGKMEKLVAGYYAARLHRDGIGFNENGEPTEKTVELTHEIIRELKQIYGWHGERGIDPQTYYGRCLKAHSFNSIISTKYVFAPYRLDIYGTDWKTVGKFKDYFYNTVLAELKTDKPRKYSYYAYLNEKMITRLLSFSRKMRRSGKHYGINIGTLFELVKTDPEHPVSRGLAENYDLTPDKLNTSEFPTFAALNDYIYQPKYLQGIMERVNVHSGKANKYGILKKDMDAAEARIEKLQGTTASERQQEKIAKLQRNYTDYRDAYNRLNGTVDEIKRKLKKETKGLPAELVDDLKRQLEDAKQAREVARKNKNAQKHLLGKARVEPEKYAYSSKKHEDKFTAAIADWERRAREYREKIDAEKVDDDMLDNRRVQRLASKKDSQYELAKKIESDQTKFIGADVTGDKEYRFSFIVNSTTPRVINFIAKQLKNGFAKSCNGMNIVSHETIRNHETGYLATHVSMFYPQKSMLTSAFKHNYGLPFKILVGLQNEIKKNLHLSVGFNLDPETMTAYGLEFNKQD